MNVHAVFPTPPVGLMTATMFARVTPGLREQALLELRLVLLRARDQQPLAAAVKPRQRALVDPTPVDERRRPSFPHRSLRRVPVYSRSGLPDRDPVLVELPQPVHLTRHARDARRRPRAGRTRSTTATRRGARCGTGHRALPGRRCSSPATTRIVVGAAGAGAAATGGAGAAAGPTAGAAATARFAGLAARRSARSDLGPLPPGAASATGGAPSACGTSGAGGTAGGASETDGSALTTSLTTRLDHIRGRLLLEDAPKSSVSEAGGCAGSGAAGASSGSSIASLPGSKSAFEPASPGANTSDVPSLTSSGSCATATDAPLVENAMSPAASAAWTRRDTSSSPVSEPASRSRRHTGQRGMEAQSASGPRVCRR